MYFSAACVGESCVTNPAFHYPRHFLLCSHFLSLLFGILGPQFFSLAFELPVRVKYATFFLEVIFVRNLDLPLAKIAERRRQWESVTMLLN